jgi:hypothetical protein
MKAKNIFFLILLFSFIIVQSVSAVNYETPTFKIIPDKSSYTPGDEVIITADVKLTDSGDDTFPDEDTLKAFTELENPQWTYEIKINGHGEEMESSKNPLGISGWQLNYPSKGNDIIVSYSFTATVPEVTSTGDLIFFDIYQTDEDGNEYTAGAAEPIKRTVLNPEDIEKLQEIVEGELVEFNDQIQSKLNAGVDVSAAQAKYNEAAADVKSSKTASYDTASDLLTEAQALIEEGENLLNQSWAQMAIDGAQETLDSVDFYITDFKNNRSMGNDARVINIETKIESAQSSLNSARSLFNDGSYTQAYTLAETSNSKAAEALTYAEEVYAEVSKGILPDFGSFTFIIIGLVIVVLAVVGYLVYSRATSWDELG